MTTPPIRELPHPDAVPNAEISADQILSVWIVDQRELAAVFPPGLYGDDVWKWGRLLGVVGRYLAHAHARAQGASEADALEAIRLNFDEALRNAQGGPAPSGVLKET